MLLMTAFLALAQQAPPRVDAFLRQRLEFSERDVRETTKGAVVVKKLEGATEEEIALVGVVRLPVSARTATEWVSQPTEGRRNVTQGGPFSPSPIPGDLATFRVPPGDRPLLRSCRVGKCVLKLHPS